MSSWAVSATESKGRERHEPADAHRTAFQVDRDRVLRSATFGALGGKAIGLPAQRHPTRAQQVARIAAAAARLARTLQLNSDLTDAIAYASALGAPPFAGAGSEALSAMVGQPFVVSEQSLRVVEALEGGHGLNLTWEVRDGVVHSAWEQTPAGTCEGQAVRVATRVIEIVDEWELAGRPALRAEARRALGDHPDVIGATLIGEVAEASVDCPQLVVDDVVDRHLAAIAEATERARTHDGIATGEHERAIHVVSSLVVYEVERCPDADLRRAVDQVCAWTDAAALAAYRDRFVPASP